MRQAFQLMILAGTVASGCGGAARQPAVAPEPIPAAAPEPMAHAHEHASELAATAGPDYTVADVRFMQHMIGHHAQAIVMAELAPERGAGEKLLRLAQKIDISQTDEIAFMRRWLRERGQGVPTDAQARAMMMPGMLNAQQMAELGASRGVAFERLFLTYMIMHHEGALQMVEELFDSPGAAQESEIFRFATDVEADQRDEIYVMLTMLQVLEGGGIQPK